jgi:DNA polymerase I-like protein with 3'-5' exonuclease and polymerase domains
VNSDIITGEARLREVVDYFLTQPSFAFDTETSGEHRGVPHLNRITWLSMATRGMCVVIPCGHPIGTKQIGEYKEPRLCADGKTRNYSMPIWEDPPEQLTPEQVFSIVKPLFFSDTITKVAHGAVFDIASTAKYWGEIMPQPFDDTIILSWLSDENRKRHGLKYLVKDIYGYAYDDENVGKCVEKYPFDMVAKYSYMDAMYCWLLYSRFLPKMEDENLEQVHVVELNVLNVLAQMRLTGAKVDVARLDELRGVLSTSLEEIKGRVWNAAGAPFNINSTPQKQKLLFGPRKDGYQGLQPWKLTDSGMKRVRAGEKENTLPITCYSTDDEVLSAYPENPLASSLREYQDTNKVLGTYVLGYLGDHDKKPCRIYDEKIYADFVQYGAATGRFSCREPNLQNIPRPDTDLGKLVRGIFVAEDAHKLVVADFGQIELVVLAHYLGRGKLYEGFHAGIDPHRMTAAILNRKDPEEVTKDERQLAKTINFAIVYGAGLNKVATTAKIDKKYAKTVLAQHRKEFPEIYTFRDKVISVCKSRRPPHITTLAGRRRRLPAIFSSDDGMRQYTERQAFNSVIQGGAADLQKIAMVRVDQDPRMGDDISIILTVHDEIVLSAPQEKAEVAADILRDAMTGEGIQNLIRVPLSVDIHVCDRWSEAK